MTTSRSLKTKVNIKTTNVPDKYDILSSNKLHSKIPIYNQGNLGSCVSNAISFLYCAIEYKQINYLNIKLSRLFIYYNGRAIEKKI